MRIESICPQSTSQAEFSGRCITYSPQTQSSLVRGEDTPLINALLCFYNKAITVLYYITLMPIIDGIVYRRHETFAKAKLMGMGMALAKAIENTKTETMLAYIISVKNGSEETRFTMEPKHLVQTLAKLDDWLQSLSKRKKCTLSNFSMTVYALPVDSRWTSFTKDRRNLLVVELAKLFEQGDFFALIKNGNFRLVVPHKEGELPQCTLNGKEHEEAVNLCDLMQS